MDKLIIKKAEQQAKADWDNKQTRYFTNGSFSSKYPNLGKEDIFYSKYYYCENNNDELFINAYNDKVNQLVEENGIPDWSPRSRVPTRQEVLDELNRVGQSIDTYKRSSIPEKRSVKSLCEKWNDKGKPLMWARLEDQQILLLAGDIHSSAGKVEVIDIKDKKGTWMTSFEFLRKHCPQMPWDKFAMFK